MKKLTKKLTKKQVAFLEFVNDPKNQRPPSYSMIMEGLGYKSKNSVFGMVAALRKKGLDILPSKKSLSAFDGN